MLLYFPVYALHEMESLRTDACMLLISITCGCMHERINTNKCILSEAQILSAQQQR